MEIRAVAPPTSEVALAEFEKRIGSRLPEDYREFLLAYNGGKPKVSKFVFADRTGPYTGSSVRAFAALSAGAHYDLYDYLDTYCSEEERRVPSEVLPIGEDNFGNLVCLAITGRHVGRVYFWNHEGETDPAAYRNMDRIADSFSEFLSKL